MYSLQNIAEIARLTLIGNRNNTIQHFLNDSRNLLSPEDTLFIALKSKRNNGHSYIPQLIQKGVRSFLVEEGAIEFSKYKDVSFLVSKNPLKSLQTLARFHRQKFNIPVIGITGSNGKTIVKEWLYQCLKEKYIICRSPKSFNSQIGVPLSVLNLNEDHTLAIFEAGISKPGEMQLLQKIIQPNLGVFTSFGTAHDEGFKSDEEKVNEKFKLFIGSEKIIVNGLLKGKIPHKAQHKSILTSKAKNSNLSFPYSDEASLSNALTCISVLREFNFSEEQINNQLSKLQHLALRLEIKNGINNCLIINDYYNSDLDSLKIALNFLQQQNRRRKKTIVVSDIEQSGISPKKLYGQLAELFKKNKIDQIIGVGNEIASHQDLFPPHANFFNDTQDFLLNLKSNSLRFSDSTILLKGARSFGFENISRVLQQKSHDTVFEINLNRLTENINYYRSLISNNVQLMCMVKATGYGSGSAEIARTLEHIAVHYLAVAYSDEGVELRESNISLPIMVMNPEEDSMDDIINFNLEPELYSFRVLDAFAAKLDALGITGPFPVHLKIDTGMRRLGFEPKDIPLLCNRLKQYSQLRIKSVFSHMVGSDDALFDQFTNEQISQFKNAANNIEKAIAYPVIKHLCNSAGITRFKSAHFNMVRLGIGMYGIGSSKAEQVKLQNVGVLKSKISQIKEINAGETVGYSRRGAISKNSRIATIPIGYADGYSRKLGNGVHGMYVKGQFCKTVGNICMDMCMIDISSVNCKEGDEVIIFENAEQIESLARALNSIPYEVLTNVSARVKRIYTQE